MAEDPRPLKPEGATSVDGPKESVQAPKPPSAPTPTEVTPVGAERVEIPEPSDDKEAAEALSASANMPGPNILPEGSVYAESDADAEGDPEPEPVKVALVDNFPEDEVTVSVPGLSEDDDYVTVITDELSMDNGDTYETKTLVVPVGKSGVELPPQVAELVANTPFVEVAR